MRQLVRSGLVATAVLILSGLANAQTTAPAKGAAAPNPKAPAANTPARPANLDQVLSTVNGDPITRAEFYGQLNAFGLPPGQVPDAEVYRVVLEMIANHKLVEQYLNSKKIPVSKEEIDKEYDGLAAQIKSEGREINVALASAGLTVPFVREEMRKKLMWRNYTQMVATDENLKKHMAANPDIFNRVLVKASHIVVLVDQNSPTLAADKAKAKAKLAEIKKQIDAKQISFADAANKFSEDQLNKEKPQGGDLGYFPRRDKFEPQFSAAAFALKQGVVSDPVDTPYGYHLILVTDRKAGKPFDFVQEKLEIQDEYMADLQERIVKEMRKTAKIEVTPMPADLFPKAAPAPTPTPPANKPVTGAVPGLSEPGKAAATDNPKR